MVEELDGGKYVGGGVARDTLSDWLWPTVR
jgi:hypothetical protein